MLSVLGLFLRAVGSLWIYCHTWMPPTSTMDLQGKCVFKNLYNSSSISENQTKSNWQFRGTKPKLLAGNRTKNP